MLSCQPVCEILYYPHPHLRLKAAPVTQFGTELLEFVDMMFDTMYKHKGIGLAAIQVDVQKQIVTIDLDETPKRPYVFINPEITEQSGEQTGQEGCLSVPGIFCPIKRAALVHVKALDRYGKPFELDATGLLSACIQHEFDHLQGKLFIDYLSRLKQQLVWKKMQKLKRERM